jgi:hypothetical protein
VNGHRFLSHVALPSFVVFSPAVQPSSAAIRILSFLYYLFVISRDCQASIAGKTTVEPNARVV